MWSIISSLSILTAIVGMAFGWWLLLVGAVVLLGIVQLETKVAVAEQISRD